MLKKKEEIKLSPFKIIIFILAFIIGILSLLFPFLWKIIFPQSFFLMIIVATLYFSYKYALFINCLINLFILLAFIKNKVLPSQFFLQIAMTWTIYLLNLLFVIRNVSKEKMFKDTISPLLQRYKKEFQEEKKVCAFIEQKKNILQKISSLYTISKEINTISFRFNMEEIISLIEKIIEKYFGFLKFVLLLKIKNETISLPLNCKIEEMTNSFPSSSDEYTFVNYLFNLERIENISNLKEKPELIHNKIFKDKKSFIAIPLLGKDKCLGVILSIDNEAGVFLKKNIEEFQVISKQLAIAIENFKLYEQVELLSRTDALTGLFRRKYFMEIIETEIKKAQRYQLVFSLLIIDIDNFNKYNITYGHQDGDNILKNIAVIFKNNLPPSVVIARYGGDEFSVIIPNYIGEEVLKLAEKVREFIAEYKFYIKEIITHLTVKIGISCYPKDGKTSQELIEAAEQALNFAKHRNKTK